MAFFPFILANILLILASPLCALESGDLISQDEKMRVLENGVAMYVCENRLPQDSALVRILYKEGCAEHVLYTLSLSGQNGDELETYLSHLRGYQPEALGVVAVGDFDEEAMFHWLTQHLSLLSQAVDGEHCPASTLCTNPTEQEIADAKNHLRQQLLSLTTTGRDLDQATLADYYTEQFFLSRAPALYSPLPEEDTPLAANIIYSLEKEIRALILPVNDGSSSGINYYADLPLQYAEMRIIARILNSMAEKNVVRLLFEKKKLERDGKRIEHVHPLKFLGFVLGDQHLKGCLRSIKKNFFKWDNFIDGFSNRMKEELGKENLLLYVPDFARALHADPHEVSHYIHKHDWEGLVSSLL